MPAAVAHVAPLLLLELNELNFEFVERYASRGALPALARLIETHGVARTRSEEALAHVEPWIQWFTVHTGKSYAQHGVYRLGDGAAAGAAQMWESLERRGLRVGAFSPLNAANALERPAFFVPDPWTRTALRAPALLRAAYAAVCQAVGENASGRLSAGSIVRLAAGLAAYAQPRHYAGYLGWALRGLRARWPRVLFLDRFLADCFFGLWRGTRPDFATLFLNGAAHLQHHYLFNSAAYGGPHRNPAWYLPPGVDPVLEVYRLYDRVAAECLALEPRPRLMIATGLHQDPVAAPVFYWRLREHGAFLRRIGCAFTSVEPLMSRDFLVRCADAAQARASAARLASGRGADGAPLFEVDDRGASLFVTLAYPRDIAPGFAARFEGAEIADLRREVVFVALKNGQHNGIGYFLDTGAQAMARAEPIPLAELYARVQQAF